ncbi:hypothetical protein E4U54_006834 [Claviceps lovelessii]|nr:hypothetical protein E4U54_006834 [Claviceps lovelessii]
MCLKIYSASYGTELDYEWLAGSPSEYQECQDLYSARLAHVKAKPWKELRSLPHRALPTWSTGR